MFANPVDRAKTLETYRDIRRTAPSFSDLYKATVDMDACRRTKVASSGRRKLMFSVIFEVEAPPDDFWGYVFPKINRDVLRVTESGRSEGNDKWLHRKYCGIFTRPAFDRFTDDFDLSAESTPTMGSLGAPGFGIGWAPAICFRSDNYDLYASAYVTPVVLSGRGKSQLFIDYHWERMVDAILRLYG